MTAEPSDFINREPGIFFPVNVKKKFSLISRSTRLLSACHILTWLANKKVEKLQWMSTQCNKLQQPLLIHV